MQTHSPVVLSIFNGYLFFPNWFIVFFQLFRRVAAALPGMDSTENKPPEDSILLQYSIYFPHCV